MSRKKATPPIAAPIRHVTNVDLCANAILTGLEASARDEVIKQGVVVDLSVGEQIYHPDEHIKDVYFPLDSVISVVATMLDGTQIEVGTIGREGISAIPLLLGGTTSANEAYCQVPGLAVKIDVALFHTLRSSASFQRLLNRYVQAYVNMLGQLAACNSLHTVYQRCARWLLMTHDRVELPRIRLTHEFLAMMLGSRRAGVSMAAGLMQKAGIIRYGNGVIEILNRSKLEGATCECYHVARQQFGGFLSSVAEARTAERKHLIAR